MNTLLQRALNNKHTSIAALVYFALAMLDKLALIWFQDVADKVAETTSSLRQLTVSYGFLTAGDAGRSQEQEPPKTP